MTSRMLEINNFNKSYKQLDIDHQSTKKKINIISNIQLKNTIENAKKKLFDEIMEKNLYKSTDESTPQYDIKGNQIYGLCLICVLSISSNYSGYKCCNCTRTYHINCILKYELFDHLTDKQFVSNL